MVNLSFRDLGLFFAGFFHYCRFRMLSLLAFFDTRKSTLAGFLYHQRGRYVRPFIHAGMAIIVAFGFILGPVLVEDLTTSRRQDFAVVDTTVLSVLAAEEGTSTLVSLKPRAETLTYEVQPGDTISSIADKFGVSIDTIRWENNLASVKDLKIGQKLRLLPATGLRHVVKYGDTIYTLAKKYDIDAQSIVDWPYNSFANDETFALSVGQELFIPNGEKPQEVPAVPRRFFAQVPSAGTLSGTGQYVWPTSGRISQGYSWYHKAIDIANSAAPDVLAADSGQVLLVGWPNPWAYGNRVLIDHGGGATTLYAHLQQVYVSAGQQLTRGQVLGRMGSTGRSTGIHLHFELRLNGDTQNPLNYLK
jgi:murein DD-endopeptidase MepM/ murein hydrolase activator NlpD